MAKKDKFEEEAEAVVEAPKFNCTNCEDSGRECVVCGAGR